MNEEAFDKLKHPRRSEGGENLRESQEVSLAKCASAIVPVIPHAIECDAG